LLKDWGGKKVAIPKQAPRTPPAGVLKGRRGFTRRGNLLTEKTPSILIGESEGVWLPRPPAGGNRRVARSKVALPRSGKKRSIIPPGKNHMCMLGKTLFEKSTKKHPPDEENLYSRGEEKKVVPPLGRGGGGSKGIRVVKKR